MTAAAIRYLSLVGWGVLACTVLFWRLGATSFWDPDEAHYAQTTRELIASGDWLTPHYGGKPFFDKPILFYLLQAVPMLLAGPTEAAARAVPAVSALAIILWTWWLGRAMVSAQVGFVAALLLTVNPAVFALARYAILDTLFTALLFGGVALLTVSALRDRPRLQYAGYVSIALATLTKGPIALVLSGLVFVIAIAMSADARHRFLGLRWVLGAAITLALAAPWFLVMVQKHGWAFVDGYFLKENLLLFSRQQYTGQPSWWFYPQILALGALPWTGVAVGRLYDDLRAGVRRVDTFQQLLWIWVVAIVGFFSFSRFKLDHYIFPVLPAVCLIIARAWADVRAGETGDRVGARIGLKLIGPVLALAGAAVAFLILDRLNLPRSALWMAAYIGVAGVVVTVRSIGRSPLPEAPWISASAMGVLYAGVLLWVVPAFEERKVVPDIARWVAAHAGERDRIGTYSLSRWNTAFRFYVARDTSVLQGLDTASEFFHRPEPFFAVMLEPAYNELVSRGVPLRVVYVREGMWVTTGRALWRQKEAPTRFVVVARALRDAPPETAAGSTRTVSPR